MNILHCHHAHMLSDFKKRFWLSLVITIPVLLFSYVIRLPGNPYLLFILSSAVFFYGGQPFLKGLVEELKHRQPGMMTLIAVAITVAYIYSSAVVFGLGGEVFFWELVTLIDIMLLGHWIEMKSVMGASRALEALVELMPLQAHRIMPDGSVTDIPLTELNPGDKVMVKPAEKMPADAEVIEGESSVNEAMLTGESMPVAKKPGDMVIGGSLNGEGSLIAIVKKTGRDSFLSQVTELVNKAQEIKSATQNLADRAAFWLTIIALSAGAVTLIVWSAVMHKDFSFSLERAVTVMVITCPHALGLAVPLVVAVSTALAAGSGLLIRNRTAFEQARRIRAIIFDKTGTLTQGKFGVTDVVSFSDITQEDILKLAASVESHSGHLIAQAVASSVKDKFPVDNFKAITGKGVEGVVNARNIKVVSPGYLRENNISIPNDKLGVLFSQGKTVVFVIVDGDIKGAVALSDIIRPEAKQAVAMLKQRGIKCMMLTGDNKQVAGWVARETGLDDYFAEVLPDEKSLRVKDVQSKGLVVAMVGDGVNDAPALAAADVGIAIGAGTDVAIEAADIVLVKNNLFDVISVLGLASVTYSKMSQNLAWATVYNLFAIPAAAGLFYRQGVVLSPAVGAVIMSLSTIIVAINAQLLRSKNPVLKAGFLD